MAKPTNETRKMLALAYLLKSSIRTGANGDFKLIALYKKCNEKMVGYERENMRDYYTICDSTFNMWKNISKYHNDILTVDELSLFVEMLSSLVQKSGFKKFFNMQPFTTIEKISNDRKSSILSVIMSIDKELNIMFNTKPTATRESLGLILTKQVKPKAVKIQKRDKAVPIGRKKLRNVIAYRRNKNREEMV